MENLIKIQSELKAPKNQFNAFGKYKYRSCEDILEALKPLLLKYHCLLTISDHVETINNTMVIRATATIIDTEKQLSSEVTAFAGIDPTKKGMDIAQCFGSSSSYARKYALNGLFLIDDTKDADATNTHGNEPKFDNTTELTEVIKKVNDCKSLEEMTAIWNEHKHLHTAEIFTKVMAEKKKSFITPKK